MAGLKITNLVKFHALLLLYEKPKHGYDIIKEVREKTGKSVSAGEIYPFLKALKKHGYIKPGKVGVREKKVYYLTSAGKNFVRGMLEKFESLIDLAIEPRLTVCAHCGCKIYGEGHKEKIKGKTLNFCCVHCAESYMKQIT